MPPHPSFFPSRAACPLFPLFFMILSLYHFFFFMPSLFNSERSPCIALARSRPNRKSCHCHSSPPRRPCRSFPFFLGLSIWPPPRTLAFLVTQTCLLVLYPLLRLARPICGLEIEMVCAKLDRKGVKYTTEASRILGKNNNYI